MGLQNTQGNKDKTKILVVDDHAMVGKGLTLLISRQPDLVVCDRAADAAQALEVLETQQIDLAIVGITYEVISATWSANGNPSGTSYSIQWSTSSDFSVVRSTIISQTYATVSGLSSETLYYLRVQSINSDNVYDGYSSVVASTTSGGHH